MPKATADVLLFVQMSFDNFFDKEFSGVGNFSTKNLVESTIFSTKNLMGVDNFFDKFPDKEFNGRRRIFRQFFSTIFSVRIQYYFSCENMPKKSSEKIVGRIVGGLVGELSGGLSGDCRGISLHFVAA